MKTALQTTLFSFIFLFNFCFSAKAQQIKVVEIKASALVEDKSTNNYAIVIYMDGILKDSIYNKKAKAINLFLETEKIYSVVFKKENYDEKIVIVDTHIPSGLRELIEEPFELQIELSKSTTVKKDLTDYPVAILKVSRKEKSLMASEDYHKMTHD